MTTNTIKFSEFAAANLATSTNKVVGWASGVNFQTPVVNTWATSARPTPPYVGLIGFNTDLNQYEYWDGAAWVQLAAGGSGSVNVGAINQMAYYATAGTAVSGLPTLINAVLRTDGTGTPSMSTTLPAGLTIPQPNVQGFTNGSTPVSGYLGELISSVISSGAAVSLVDGVAKELTHIDLTAGFWLVWGNITFLDNTLGTQFSSIQAWIQQDSIARPDSSLYSALTPPGVSRIGQPSSLIPPQKIINISSSKTVYIAGQASFAAPTIASFCGGIYALRIR